MARMSEQSSRREAPLVVMFTRIIKEFGRGDWIRTSDPLRPRQVRYQAALRPDLPIILRTAAPTGERPARSVRAVLKPHGPDPRPDRKSGKRSRVFVNPPTAC